MTTTMIAGLLLGAFLFIVVLGAMLRSSLRINTIIDNQERILEALGGAKDDKH